MKKYKYINAEYIDEYPNWAIECSFSANCSADCNMIIISHEDIPIQDYIKLNEATIDELLAELKKRLNKGKSE